MDDLDVALADADLEKLAKAAAARSGRPVGDERRLLISQIAFYEREARLGWRIILALGALVILGVVAAGVLLRIGWGLL